MPPTPRHRRRAVTGALGLFAAAAVTGALAAPAAALAPPADIDGAEAARSAGTTSFTADLQTEIHIADESRPSSFMATPDGRRGIVTSAELNEVTIIDMATRTVTHRIDFPGRGGDYVRVSDDGTRAYFAVLERFNSTGLGVVDLTTNSLLKVIPLPNGSIEDLELTASGDEIYVLDLMGEMARYSTETGELLAKANPGLKNARSLLLRENETQLLFSVDNLIFTLSASDFTEISRAVVPGVNSVTSMYVDSSEDLVYFSDSSGSTLGQFVPSTGETVGAVKVGNPMHDTVGVDRLNRSFGNVPYWNYLMAADFGTGQRSESFRETPTAPFSLASNPVTGELLSANGGWSNSTKGSTVTIVNTPSVTDPSDAAVTELGGTVRFETEAIGIKPNRGGGVTWQSSADGETWVDIAGAHHEQLDVEVTREALAQQYRVRWVDDFWGDRGVSAAAVIASPLPKITFEGPLAEGTVGAEYPSTLITATGGEDLAWSVLDEAERSGLPAGLSLDAATGALSGTPTATGTFDFTVRVTDMFGEDTRSYELVVGESTVGPGGGLTPGDTSNPVNDKGGDPLGATGAGGPALLGLAAAGLLAAGGAALAIRRTRSAR
ncbi:putative Ig domain-containing protein [Leucobacter albus]|uniref:Ig domain-containing protein n=1 Tax=Leucobacter albus TaxID=272210 RepID=A0ABW3TNT5_9MICO